jgi:hypothetical protein
MTARVSPEGDDHVAGYVQADFAMMLKMMARLLAHYLATGSMFVEG